MSPVFLILWVLFMTVVMMAHTLEAGRQYDGVVVVSSTLAYIACVVTVALLWTHGFLLAWLSSMGVFVIVAVAGVCITGIVRTIRNARYGYGVEK